MTDQLTPPAALEFFRALVGMNWRPLDDNDYATFADAGENGRIAFCTEDERSTICQLFDFRAEADGGLLCIIGGEGLTLEIHGMDFHQNPISLMLPIMIYEA